MIYSYIRNIILLHVYDSICKPEPIKLVYVYTTHFVGYLIIGFRIKCYVNDIFFKGNDTCMTPNILSFNAVLLIENNLAKPYNLYFLHYNQNIFDTF